VRIVGAATSAMAWEMRAGVGPTLKKFFKPASLLDRAGVKRLQTEQKVLRLFSQALQQSGQGVACARD
jgi:hypothetical protein